MSLSLLWLGIVKLCYVILGWVKKPVLNSRPIDTFIAAVKRGISLLCEQGNYTPSRCNMSKKELVAIEQLSQNDTLILKPADKGGALVVMDTSFYVEEIHRQLNDKEVYEVITADPKFRLGRIIRHSRYYR